MPAHEPHSGDEQERLDEERARKEAEELAAFERRAAWWSLHYGGAADEADERIREALEHADRLPPEPERSE